MRYHCNPDYVTLPLAPDGVWEVTNLGQFDDGVPEFRR